MFDNLSPAAVESWARHVFIAGWRLVMRPLLTAVGRALVTPFLVLALTGCISTVHVQPYEA